MSEIVDQVLDSVTNSEPSEVVVQDIEESTPDEPVVEEPVVEESVPEKSKQMDQVINEIRELLKEKIPVSNELVSEESLEVSNDSSDNVTEDESNEFNELTEDLKQRIAELDYLRECCGNWFGSGGEEKKNFLTAWENKNISVNSNVNYDDTLNQLEKLPEIVKLCVERTVTTDSNNFKNIESYILDKPLFNEKSLTEKVEVLEQLIDLLTDCANGKMRVTQIEEVIENLY